MFISYNTMQVEHMGDWYQQDTGRIPRERVRDLMIRGDHISKSYKGSLALDDVSFTFEEGGIYGIIGHNGAGKTTLLKCITGLVTPTSGSLSINGIDVAIHPEKVKALIGYLPEESRLYETMTAEDYISFFGECYGLRKDVITERRERLFAALALETDGKRLGEFSKGMKRKVALARSLVHDPSVLIYDEATSGLDPMTSRYIVDFLRDLRKENKTIVMSAHNLYQVEAVCDRIMILRRGKVTAEGSMKELRDMFGSIRYTVHFKIADPAGLADLPGYTFDGSEYRMEAGDIGDITRISTEITARGGLVARIESHYPTLEEMLVQIGK
jgi:ABC-2 type transport system ATP-binding protein